MPKFTKEQDSVINKRDVNLLVSASAGSGKTTVMIERIVRLIEEGKTTLNKIVVLTFTNNSANDMKEKLYKNLSEKNNKNCRNALFDIASSNISTIHQFCKKLITRYFYACDTDPAFGVISENEALVLKNKALDNTLDKFFFSEPDKLKDFLENNFEKRSFDQTKEMILSVFTFLSVLDDPMGWIKSIATKNYDSKVNENDAVSILVKNARYILSYYKTEFEKIAFHVKKFLDVDKFTNFFGSLEMLKKILSETENSKFIDSILNVKFSFLPTSRDKVTSSFKEESIAPIYKQFKLDMDAICKSFASESSAKLEEFLKSNKFSLEFLCELAKDFCNEYAKIKQQKCLLDFDDLEARAKLLLDQEKIREEIRNTFDYCFVDEYQDVNILQEAIISSVAKKSFYFGVGDAKQAIYGFRLCSPEIFIEKFNKYKESENKDVAASLNTNFRSKINILRFVNKVFDVIMTEQTAQISYRDTARFQSENIDEKSKVKIKIISQDKGKEIANGVYSVKNHVFDADEELSSAEFEAVCVFEEIYNLVTKQNAKFSDIAILSRSRDSNDYVKTIYRYLEKKGVPLISNFGVNLLNFPEISLLHNFLKLLNNIYNDAILYKVISHPNFNFSINDLIEIRNSSNFTTFAECFYAQKEKDEKIKSFCEFLEKQSLLSQSVSVGEFVLNLFQTFLQSGVKEFCDPSSAVHLNAYLSFINGLAPSSLTDYCRLTDADQLQANISRSETENAVQFCTIHSSKGLEYKHVILIGAGRGLEKPNTKSVLYDEQIGLGIKGFDAEEEKRSTPVYNAINIVRRKKEFAEEIRLLYVALTRAKENLTVIGQVRPDDLEKFKTFADDFEILKADSYLELILRSLSPGELSRLKAEEETTLIYEQNEVGSCQIVTKIEDRIPSLNVLDKENLSMDQALKARDTWAEITNVNNVYLKNSVSSLMKAGEEIDYSSTFFDNDEKISTALGTSYHSLFEQVKFDDCDNKIKINSNVDRKYLDMFLKSPLYEFCKNKTIEQEHPFLIYDSIPEEFGLGKDKVLLQGVIDLLVIEKDGFTVVDYKASHASDEILKQRYTPQLTLYAYCAQKILKIPCKKKLIYKIFSGKTIEIE